MSVDERREAAIERVGTLLSAEPLNATLLSARELHPYRDRKVTHGWRLTIGFLDEPRRLDVLAGPTFPREPVLVALVDRPPFLTWTHVEKDGVLCLLPSSAAIDHAAPAEVAASVLTDACELIAEQLRGEAHEDFRREFLSYWGGSSERENQAIWSLLRPEGPSRNFYYWPAKGFYLIGESTEQLTQWLVHYQPGFKIEPENYLRGTLLWLPVLPLPSDYPKQASDVIDLARTLGCDSLLDVHLNQERTPLVVIGGESGVGPCFAATFILEPSHDRPPRKGVRSRTGDGFRTGRIPRDLLRTRCFGANPVGRAIVDRADGEWVHGRGHDIRFAKMRDANVIVLGCGSLGSHLAMRLAEAGIGTINLVDPQPFQWANVGRHALSAHHIGRSKADELAKMLRQQYPHAKAFHGHRQTCEELLVSNAEILFECDLIVAAMGDWGAEGALNAWHVQHKLASPIVYAWSEAHAAAGHVVIIKGDACLQCGFHNNGDPRFKVTAWDEPTTLQEPGCGAVFQPYGPVEFAHITALAAEAALDCLLDRASSMHHRIWVGRKSLLDAAGGRWSNEFLETAASRPLGGFIEERHWPGDPNCSECSRVR